MKYGKRHTNPERWTNPRFRKLSPHAKLVYLYILEHCDWAGFMEVDIERVQFDTGISIVDVEQCISALNVEILVNNGWLFVMDFLKLQDNDKLNPDNNAHKNILNKFIDNQHHFTGIKEFEENTAPYKPLISPYSEPDEPLSRSTSKGISEGKSNGISESNGIDEAIKNDKKHNCTFCIKTENGECGLAEEHRPKKCRNPEVCPF